MTNPFDKAALKRFLAFIEERAAIRDRRLAGKPKPWTKDPIMQAYRFCNVEREHDTVTQWVAESWRAPNAADPDLWFAMVVARLVNTPATLRSLGYPVPFRAARFVGTIQQLQAAGLQAYSGAYIVSTNGHAMNKAEYLSEHVLAPLWAARKVVRPRVGEALFQFCARLMAHNGMAGFMAGQVVADVKYTAPLSHAHDWWNWAVSGPGSRRGMNRILNVPKDAPCKEDVWRTHVGMLREIVHVARLAKSRTPLHAQDVQNCLCEFDKIERVRLGEGRPRSTYPGAK